MKKLLLIPALMATMAMAKEQKQYDWEITPLIGYNHAANNVGPHDYGMIGGEVQYNGLESKIKPELSILASNEADFAGVSNNTDLLRVALNGVYDFDKIILDIIGPVTPLIKAGLGYEYSNSDNKALFDVGAGAKILLTETIALKLEALYILATDGSNSENNLAFLAGLSIPFGEKAQKEAPKSNTIPVAPIVAAAVIAAPTVVDGDDDNDGVKNSVDKCPNSPLKAAVDATGCQIIIDLHVNFKFDSDVINTNEKHDIQIFTDFLNKHPNYKANIVGHTDSQGDKVYNQVLSLKRANAVKNILIKKGIDSSRLSAEGRGETTPIVSNDTKEGRAKNRRVEAEEYLK